MTTIVTRTTKGTPLSWAEADANFTNLNTDKLEATDRPYSDTNPIMDSTAAQGTSPKVSRQDHVHPSDTSKINKSGDTMTGQLKGITPVSVDDLTRKDYVDGILTTSNISSGTYTPTGMTSSGINTKTANPHRWLRIGNVVTFSGSLTTTATVAGPVFVALPVPVASNFTTIYQANGGGGVSGATNTGAVLCWSAGYANDIRVVWNAQSTGSEIVSYSCTYIII